MKQFKLFFNQKVFFVKLLIIIIIIGILLAIIFLSIPSIRKMVIGFRGLNNRKDAKLYCSKNPGESILNGDTVYCDKNCTMWSETQGLYKWQTEETTLPTYANGDCNNLTASDMKDYPACNTCRNLEYAGFSKGWRLPTQDGRDCPYPCHSAPGRQLWGLGQEICGWDSSLYIDVQTSCIPAYDNNAEIRSYWSSTEYAKSGSLWAWRVGFSDGLVTKGARVNQKYIRCVLY